MNVPRNDFDPLQRLLSLKRHEQPPPGYFTHFSDKVVARIEAEGLASRHLWWQGMWRRFEARPLAACGYGCMIAGLLAVAAGLSQSVEPDVAEAAVVTNPWYGPTPATARFLSVNSAAIPAAIEQADSPSSITPVISSTAPNFLFDVSHLRARPASYTFR